MRTVWPAKGKMRGMVYFTHGYCSHINRFPQAYLENEFAKAGYAFAGVDFHGHGYSDGIRASIDSHKDVIDDALNGLLAVYGMGDGEYHVEGQADPSLPLFLMGHSMGGAVAMLMGTILSAQGEAEAATPFAHQNMQHIARLGSIFRGVVGFCPCVDILPEIPTLAQIIFIGPLAYLFPNWSIPEFIMSENAPVEVSKHWKSKNWSSRDYHKYVRSDELSYNSNIRMNTLWSLLRLGTAIDESVGQMDFPFILYHDEKDATVKYEGSVRIMEYAPSDDKQLITLPNALHDIIANRLEWSTQHGLDWVESRMGSSATFAPTSVFDSEGVEDSPSPSPASKAPRRRAKSSSRK
jgi:acylglycerol lipase